MPENSDSSPKDSKVLDLLDTTTKPSRRERQRKEAEVVPPAPSVLDAQKANALDLFADDKKPKVRKTARTGKSVIGTISKILDQKEASANPSPEIIVPEPVAAVMTAVEAEEIPSDDPKLIVIKPPILIPALAARLGLKPFNIMADLIKIGVFPAPNQPLEPEIAAKICEIHGFIFEREKRDKDKGVHKVEVIIKEPEAPVAEPVDLLKYRPPIITIMGHVDHGKTSLLDYLRKTKITAGEAGGITQHIGAYQVLHNDLEITFLDTPGHAIFSDMRARGADITDIVVVAADDGIMPQTLEAIKHAKKARKTIIVAINKCDLPSANVDRVKSQLAENGLQTTDFGGDTEFAEVSAITGKGMDDLLDLMVLQAEVLELKANPKSTARAAVIEARVVPGRGTTATVIVESGTLKVGTPFICGPFAGKVRSLINDRGVAVKSAHPGMPVEVIGFEELPNVGDHLTEMKTEREAKALATDRQEAQRLVRLKPQHRNRMEDLYSMVRDGGGKAQLKLILKCDVQGSVEAIRKAVLAITSDKVECSFITAAAGMIDVVFAEIDLPDSGGSALWTDELRTRSNSLREALARHPWAITLMDSSPTPGPHTLRHHNAVIGCLRAAGFTVAMTAHAFSAIDSYVYGFAMQEKSLPFETPEETTELANAILKSFPEGLYPHLREMAIEHVLRPGYRYGDEFGLGLEILLEGLDNRR